eukprot:5623651-Alexandrium_andersonii.AAC.1
MCIRDSTSVAPTAPDPTLSSLSPVRIPLSPNKMPWHMGVWRHSDMNICTSRCVLPSVPRIARCTEH